MTDPRTPCIVGVAQRTWHRAPAPEPLAMWEQVGRAAVADAGVPEHALAGRIDDLSVVHCQSWTYDDPPARLAAALGIAPAQQHTSILAGTAHQRLINAAAARLLDGTSQAALIAGGEALATLKAIRRAGEVPAWSHPSETPNPAGIDFDEWFLPTERAHGIFPAWLTFAMFDVARRARRGLSVAEQRALDGLILARASEVAARNPHAWFPEARTAEQIITPGPDNRVVAWPYTKLMNAIMDVDMASATLMVTHALAEELGIPQRQRVYLRSWAFGRDETHVASRAELGASPAMRVVHNAALAAAGIGVAEVSAFDLYSCFPGAVLFACDALGLDPSDPRGLTVTGGRPSFGGPSANYMGHSVASMVEHLRAGPSGGGPAYGFVSGIGMHMTKHVAAVYATEPGPAVAVDEHDTARQIAAEAGPAHPVVAEADAVATVATAVVVHQRAGAPFVSAICDLPGGRRCYAHSHDPALVDQCSIGDPVGLSVRVKHHDDINVMLVH